MAGPAWKLLYDDAGTLLLMRQVGLTAFQFVEALDMDEHCGRDNEGHPQFVVALEYVDVSRLSERNIKSAMSSCGYGEDDGSKDHGYSVSALAQVCRDYGLKAPLWDGSFKNRKDGIREAKVVGDDLLDPQLMARAMSRPVNRIGSTADEFMRGDMDSAMTRASFRADPFSKAFSKSGSWAGAASGRAMEEAKPADWLPYLLGYMEGFRGSPQETGDDLVKSYVDGHKRGTAVRLGLAKPPSWIKQ